MEKGFGFVEIGKHGIRKAIDKEGKWVPQSQFVAKIFERIKGEYDRK